MALAYLLDPQIQISEKNGLLNVAGFLRVYLNGTDDRATTYKDFNGTLNTADIVLDNNGRAVVIADSSKSYRLEVYTPDGELLWTQYPLNTLVGGAGGASGVVVESSDGTVDVTRYNDGGIVHYDLSTRVTEDASRWGGIVMRGTGVEGDGMWHPVPVDSTQGPAPYATGWMVEKDCVADIAAAMEFSCDDNTALNTIDVQCEFVLNGTVDRTEGGMIDPTRPKGRVSFEYKGAVSEGDKIDCRIYVRCNQDVTLFLSGYAVYNEEVDGVVGGGSGGDAYEAGDFIYITTANVINATGLQPISAMSSYQTTAGMSAYATTVDLSAYQPVSGMSAYATTVDLSSKLDASASSSFIPVSASGDFVPYSAVNVVEV